MNILIVTNGYPPTALGGVEIYSADLAHGLTKNGHRVTIFCRESDFSLPDGHISDEIQNQVRIIRFVNDFKTNTSFIDTIINAAIERTFSDYMIEVKPDIIHFQHLIALSARLPLIANEQGMPFVTTRHDYWSICHRGRLIDW